MLEALRKRLEHDEEGFTLIELMVVVLIIAILLAIAIPTFLGARSRAQDRHGELLHLTSAVLDGHRRSGETVSRPARR